MKEKIKNFCYSLKRNGWKTEIRRMINYIRFHKTVPNAYQEWQILNEPSQKDLEMQKTYESCLKTNFLILVDEEKSISGLQEQTYSHFQVKTAKPTEYETILQQAQNVDYILFIGNHIHMYPFALHHIVKYLEYNDCYAFYADHDTYKEESKQRENPEFKPDFAYDTLLAKNYIGNFIGVKYAFLRKHPTILQNIVQEEPFYDMLLKITEKITRPNQILHVDQVLYGNKQTENIQEDIQKKVIAQHLQRKQIPYETIKTGKFPGQYHIVYSLPEEKPKVSIVIPNMDHISDLKTTVESILHKSTYKNIEIIIVENNSKEKETFAYYEELKSTYDCVRIEKLAITYFNYSCIVNFGVEKATGKYVLLLNNDVEVITENWIEEMLMYVEQKRVGICGARLYFPDKSIQHAGVTIGIRGLAGHRYRELPESDFSAKDAVSYVQNLSAVTAACFMISKENYEKVLGFDEKLAVAFNDVDFCLKILQEDLLIIYNPFVELYHYESKSRGQDDSEEKQKRFAGEYELFVKRWCKEIQKGDRYFNKNYRLDTDIPTINYNTIR